ncbi:MAG: prolyl oligopeptidase family serine peptidase, partial [Bacteroidota bacterium]
QIDVNYQKPSSEILELVEAPLPPLVRMNTAGTLALLLHRHVYQSIAELSEKEMRLAGLRINPVTNSPSRQRTYFNLTIKDLVNNQTFQVEGLPPNGQFNNFAWSFDEQKVAFSNTTIHGVELWLLDLATKSAKQLTKAVINANLGSPFQWMKNNRQLLVRFLPKDRQPLIDTKSSIPTGPTVSVNDGQKAQNRTYQDLLKNKVDEFNFDQLTYSELYLVDLEGQRQLWKEKAIYKSIFQSPDGNYFLVSTIERPYSYLVPYTRFPFKTIIYDKAGKEVKAMLEVPLMEELPKGFMAVRTGMRNLYWRSDQPASLYWNEALDGGDPANASDYRDATYTLAAPFSGRKKLLIKTKNRFSFINWGNDQMAIAHDRWWNTRNRKTYLFNPSNNKIKPRLLFDRNYQDIYSDPGSFVTKENDYGRQILDINDDYLYLIGQGHSEDGVRPFIDRFNYQTLATKRLYQADDVDKRERLIAAMDVPKGIYLTRLESKSDYPNYFFRNVLTGELTPITDFKNPFAAMQGVYKEVIKYERPDGVELSAELYLPVGYDRQKKEQLPLIMWAYPREYKDKNSASQVAASKNDFTFPFYGSPLYWVMKGYAVLDDVAFPIVGEKEEEPNDSFIKQLVANAKAAIDAVDQLGYIDRQRVAIGGHSYGAFMTANLLTHSNLFAAGIARSGAYNRTLTPFGFQSEERTFWEAPEVYHQMSPFMHADKMKTPLLLIHGEEDNNSGTYPMQSERYFNALKGLGATVRLVMLPKESHGYAAKESILHLIWEQDQWLEKYVKNRTETEEAKAAMQATENAAYTSELFDFFDE